MRRSEAAGVVGELQSLVDTPEIFDGVTGNTCGRMEEATDGDLWIVPELLETDGRL